MFFWSRPVPEAWRCELARLAPKVERAGHLALFWESGTPAEPVQRFVIYEAIPLAYVPDWKRQAFFAQPPCRCAVEPVAMQQCSRCKGVQSPGRQRILDYLLKTECLALPFWIVQGSSGGHKHRFSQVEKNWQVLMGQPEEAPAPGSLPYAPFDRRVVEQLRRYDRARLAYASLATALEGETEAAELAFRAALADYVDRSVEAAFDDLAITRKSALVDHMPNLHTHDRIRVDPAEAREAFIARKD